MVLASRAPHLPRRNASARSLRVHTHMPRQPRAPRRGCGKPGALRAPEREVALFAAAARVVLRCVRGRQQRRSGVGVQRRGVHDADAQRFADIRQLVFALHSCVTRERGPSAGEGRVAALLTRKPASQRTCELASCSSSLLLPGLSAQARNFRGRLPADASPLCRAAKALNNASPATAAARPTRSAVLAALRLKAASMRR